MQFRSVITPPRQQDTISPPNIPYSSFRIRTLVGADLRNLCILIVAFVSVVAIVSPSRSFPITDDWIYSQSVRDLLNGSYRPHEWSQAIALSHVAWGAFFAGLFGLNFTVLSIANLTMGGICIVLFYLLLCQFDVSSSYALLGSVLLGFNPLFLHLSYSFMTDITFLALVLAACLCYIRGLQGHSPSWLWLGALSAALSYFTRQYGILLVAAALFYIWWSRRWRWKEAMAIALIPVSVAVAYELWKQSQPAGLAAVYLDGLRSAIQPVEYAFDHMQRAVWALSILGLFLVPLLRVPRRYGLGLVVIVPLGYFLLRSWLQFGSLFPSSGNTMDNTGFFMADYYAARLWPELVWTLLGAAGALSITVFIITYWEQLQTWVINRAWLQRRAEPLIMVYTFGLAVAVSILTITPLVLERYFLPVLWILILIPLREFTRTHPERSPSWRWVPVVAVALLAIGEQQDYMAHARARWQAAEQLTNRGIPPRYIDAGFEWQGYYLFDEAAKEIREGGDFSIVSFPPRRLLDPAFVISDLPIDGHSQVYSVMYRSWLNGGQERYVLVLERK